MFSYFRHIMRGGKLGQTTPEHVRLARFLLHRLPAAESDAIKERFFQDDSFLAEMEEVERDLLDAYACGGLSELDRRDADLHLMNSELQREKLRLAFALGRRQPVRNPATLLRWAVAAAVFLCLAGSAVRISRLSTENQRLHSELATLEKNRGQAQNAPAVAFLLMPVDRSAAEQHLEIGSRVTLVRLNLALEAGPGGAADIRVRTASGSLVIEQHGVAVQEVAGAAYLSVWLPGAALPAGSYAVSVAEGGRELDYAFRLIHHK